MAQGFDWLPPHMHFDWVCGQILTQDEALGPILHDGEQFYFCSMRCQSHFLRTAKAKPRKAKAVILAFPVEQKVVERLVDDSSLEAVSY